MKPKQYGSDYTEEELNRPIINWQKRQMLSELLGMPIENRTDEEVHNELFYLIETNP